MMDKITQDWRRFSENIHLESEQHGEANVALYRKINAKVYVIKLWVCNYWSEDVELRFDNIEHVRLVAVMFNNFLTLYDAQENE